MGAQGGDYWLVEVYAILVTHRLSAPDFSSMHATKFSFGGTMYLQYILTVPWRRALDRINVLVLRNTR